MVSYTVEGEQNFAKAYWLAEQGVALPSILLFIIIGVLFACIVKGSDRMVKNIEMILYLLDSILNFDCIFDMCRNAMLTNAFW